MIKEITEYQIWTCSKEYLDVFVQQINEQIKKGWQPVGRAFIDGDIIHQTMVSIVYSE